MRILWMEATFGKLNRARLELKPGLNCIEAPNEWGKSTWCAFLTAMLYGVDTRERSTKSTLSVKEKYAPWSGRPMEGVLCLEHHGRRITLERRSGRSPMSEFRAYETDSGLPVPGMTGENCGEMLLGVEKSVFLRSAFVRFSDLPVEADEALRRRLNALVTTGDESGSGDRLGRKLAELKRKIQYNRTGLLPQIHADLRDLKLQLQENQGILRRLREYESRITAAAADRQKLQLHLQWLDYARSREQQQRLEEAAGELEQTEEEIRELEEASRNALPMSELRARVQQGYERLDEMEDPVPKRVRFPRPAALRLTAAGVVLAAAVLLLAGGSPIAGVLLFVGAVLLGIPAVSAVRKYREECLRQEEAAWEKGQSRRDLEDELDDWQEQMENLQALGEARVRAREQRRRMQDLQIVARMTDPPQQPDPMESDRPQTEQQLETLTRQMQQWRSYADQLRGRMELLTSPEQLQRQIAALEQRQTELQKWYRAIEYSQKALETASRELQRRFVPQITGRTEQLLTRMTGGVYDRLSIGADLELSAGREEESGLRELRWRSDGTGDQMYLALRIAVWEMLCPEAPLILDDVLVRYDEARLQQTMDVLWELGGTHQILLYSCRPVGQRDC